eukprot:gnl/MRDRNA2_/MRDRNA2_88521_c0_seq1.p2 gnl/MRDRNA2_/MRDRNA2_88521_c0~~gnl/MRDRNA2_/MRDRNA2_88521_c0_seq1.p2  ORF type:complete len:127 (-),score=33.64 gnl/MRDRNA2_/MRDRNA2_88521_c0_seq1:82-462(-)
MASIVVLVLAMACTFHAAIALKNPKVESKLWALTDSFGNAGGEADAAAGEGNDVDKLDDWSDGDDDWRPPEDRGLSDWQLERKRQKEEQAAADACTCNFKCGVGDVSICFRKCCNGEFGGTMHLFR